MGYKAGKGLGKNAQGGKTWNDSIAELFTNIAFFLDFYIVAVLYILTFHLLFL